MTCRRGGSRARTTEDVQSTPGNGAPVPEDLWLLFDLTDSRIEGRFLKGILFFDHFDTAGAPVVMSTILTGPSNTTQLWPIPPMQGALPAGTVVRLRQVDSGNCLRSTNSTSPPSPTTCARTISS